MANNKRTYSDPSYGGHKVITFGGISGATQTLATNGVYACHQFMFPARLLSANLRFGGDGIASGITDMTSMSEFQLFKSTDSGSNLEAVLGTFDPGLATGTHLMEDAALSVMICDNLTETDFDTGDFLIYTVEGDWDDPINMSIEAEVFEKFSNDDN